MLPSRARRVVPPATLVVASTLALSACGTSTGASTAGATTTSATGSSTADERATAAGSTAGHRPVQQSTVLSETATTVSIKHAQGTTTVPKNPTKVAVLDLAALDTVQALGKQGTVAAATRQTLPPFLSAFATPAVTDLGSMKEPKVEAVAALKPDLIVVGPRSAPRYAELSKIAPTIDLTASDPDLVKAVTNQTTTLAAVYGAQGTAKAALAALDAKVAGVRAKATNAGPSLVLMTSGGKVSAFGPQSRFGLLHTTLGIPATSMAIKDDRHGQAVSFELVRTAKPERLYVIDRDAAIGESGKAAKQVLDNALVRTTPAWKNDQVTYLDGARWYVVGGGLSNLPAMIDEVAASL